MSDTTDSKDFWNGMPIYPPASSLTSPSDKLKAVVSKLMENSQPSSAFLFSNGANGRQEKILVIPIPELLGIMTGSTQLYLPPDIPADSLPTRVFQDDDTYCICVLLAHPSFPAVPPGYVVQRYNAILDHSPEPILFRTEEAVNMYDESEEREI
jgi:hypothetical protein